jgi:hypothetical protein
MATEEYWSAYINHPKTGNWWPGDQPQITEEMLLYRAILFQSEY